MKRHNLIICIALLLGLTVSSFDSFGQLTGSIISIDNVLCYGQETGSITVLGSGGTEPYQYKLGDNDYQESGTFENLAAGTYSITIKDNTESTFVLEASITEPEPLEVSIVSQTDVECPGFESGAVDVSVTGGTPPYSFNWSTVDGFGLAETEEDQNGLSTGSYILIVTDANGCLADLGVTIVDSGENEPPVIIGGANGSAECTGSDPSLNPEYIAWRDNFAGITATDNCGIASINYDENTWFSNGCVDENSVVFVVKDNNDNTSLITFAFRISDNTPPVISGGSDGMAERTGNNPNENEAFIDWMENLAGITASDLCGDVEISFEKGEWTEIENTVQIIVHFIATDECGLTTLAEFTFTIVNSNSPTISCPPDINIECNSDIPPPDTNQVEASGEGISISHVGDISDGNSCPEIITRTYRVTDENDNTAECSQTIVVHDLTSPIISCPGPITIGGIEELPEPNTNLLTATDNCTENPVITFVSDATETNNCEDLVARTYMATDNCGNTTSCTQLIIIDDITEPIIICPDPIFVSCISEIPEADISEVTAVDNCGIVTIVHAGDISDGNTCPQTIFRFYQASDESGNLSECSQTITVNDETPPVLIGVPEDIIVDCDDIPDLPVIEAEDNCSPADMINIEFTELANDVVNCKGAIVRQWIATDLCGNSTMGYQTILVENLTSLFEISDESDLKVYPNPSNGSFKLEYSGQSAGKIILSIADLSGKEILHQTYAPNPTGISELIHIPECPSGIYFLRINSDIEILYRKIIVE